mgnify:CR=1 FL=1
MSIVNEFNEYRERMNDVILGKGNLVMKRLWNLDTNTYQEGALDVKTKEMLGLVAQMESGARPVANTPADPNAPVTEEQQFSKVVLASTEDVWGRIFSASGEQYPAPTMVLFSGAVQSACGGATSAVGPFYCPGDRKVYLDTQFFDEMTAKLGGGGDFAQAYVIAHEVGHCVNNCVRFLRRIG